MSFAQLKNLLLLGVTFEIDLQNQKWGFFVITFVFDIPVWGSVGPISPSPSGKVSCVIWGRVTGWVQTCHISGFPGCQGMVSTTCIMAEWHLAWEEWAKTLGPRPGHRDAQRWRWPAAISAQRSSWLWGCPTISSASSLPVLVPAPPLHPWLFLLSQVKVHFALNI